MVHRKRILLWLGLLFAGCYGGGRLLRYRPPEATSYRDPDGNGHTYTDDYTHTHVHTDADKHTNTD